MSELSIEERCRLAAGLIEQSPPGEVNDVINDIRTIIGNDESLMSSIIPYLRAYNLAQLHPVEHAASEGSPAHHSLLSEGAILPGSSGTERFVDAEGKRSFVYDHVGMTVGGYEPYESPAEEETFRSELSKSLSAYTKNHFSTGFFSVTCSQHPLLPPAPTSAPSAPAVPVPMASEAVAPPVTDIIPEQIGTGENEPAPTPAPGGPVDAKREEVDQPGGLEKVDELVEEIRESEMVGEVGGDAQAGVEEPKVEESGVMEESKMDVPLVEESTKEEEPVLDVAQAESSKDEATTMKIAQAESEVAASTVDATSTADIPERKQERVENPTYTLEVVGNRYNTSNFWTGRWRTRWIVDQAAGSVRGTIQVDVHYYEQGNVQLAAKHEVSFPCPTDSTGKQSIASQIVTTISRIETNYHMELNDVYGDLGDKAFRALRRALPVTRQKMEWEKVSGYSLGSDLTKARA